MLSTKPIKNVGEARFYFYEKDNYYFKDSPDAKELSQWYGRGAKELGLTDYVEPAQFESLLQGSLPNNIQLGKKVNGEIKHRAGYDLTFNAPKSVSITAFIGGDKRLLEAHTKAVQKALDYVERICAQARSQKNGQMHYENTGNLIFATFLQDLSRALDPHLHTHCVTMNATQRMDGFWRALASNMNESGPLIEGFWERVRHYQRYLGMIYRAELAYKVKQLGYELEKKDKGLWEIAGVDSKDITFFSKRRQDIEKFMAQHGLEGARAASYATLITRMAKDSVDREKLYQHWVDFAKTDFKQLIQSSIDKVKENDNSHFEPSKNSVSTEVIKEVTAAVNYAINHLSSNKQVINHIDIVNTALQAVIDNEINVTALIKAIGEAQKQGKLIPLGNNKGNISFTTPELLRYEKETLNHLSKMMNNVKPLSNPQSINAYFTQHNNLTASQKSCLKKLFTSTDQMVAIEGSKHSQKESLYKPIELLAKVAKHKVIVLANTAKEATALQQKYHLKRTDTIAKFIIHNERDLERFDKLSGQGVIALIDNAQTLSTKDTCALTNISAKTGLKLVPVYDQKSIQSLGLGTSISQMKQHGMMTIHLDEGETKTTNKIKEKTLADYIVNTIPKIKKNVIAIQSDEMRFDKMASHYSNLDPQMRLSAKVLMPTKAQSESVNLLIHQQLKDNAQLTSDPYVVAALIPRRLTQAEYTLAKNYRVGQLVRFNETVRTLKIAKGSYCKIKAIREKENTVVLENSRRTTILWNPQKISGIADKIEVFDEKQREFVKGEKVMALRNMKDKNICNNDEFTVQDVNANSLTLVDEKNNKIKINLNHPQWRHFDYAYATTPHRLANDSYKIIIAHQYSNTRMTNQRQFYKILHSASAELFIYTDNCDRYFHQLKQNSGDKISLIDTILSKDLSNDFNDHLSCSTHNLLNNRLNEALTMLIAKYGNANKDPKTVVQDAVNYALCACAEKEAAFTHKAILETALKHALGDVSPSMLEKAIKIEEKQGGLIRGLYVSDGTRWATPAAIERERFILNWASEGKGKYEPCCSTTRLQTYLEKTTLRDSQKEAVRLIIANSDRLVNIQGAPGTGKTTLLCTAYQFLKDTQVRVKYLAPTHSAVNELSRAGLNAMTLQQCLADFRKPNAVGATTTIGKQLFILDEVSFVSNAQMKELFHCVEAVNGRVVMVGDKKQNPAIEAGKPQTILEWHGVKTAYLDDIQRQKDPVLLRAVKAAYQGSFADSFKLLDQRLLDDKGLLEKARQDAKNNGQHLKKEEINAKELRIQATVAEYFKHKDCLLMTLTNNDRQNLNETIREIKLSRGELSGDATNTAILEPQHLTEVERSRVSNFRVGQLLRFSGVNKTLDIEKGDYLPIKSIDVQQNICVLQNKNGQSVAYRPKEYQEGGHSGIEVYEIKDRELRAGDSIRWTRSNKSLDLVGGQIEKVVTIHAHAIELQSETGAIKIIDLSKREYQHWDHAYAVTVHYAQGKTRENVVALAESHQINLANQPNFIVMISRAVEKATIITDNKDELLKQILKNTGEKMSALEVIGEISPPRASKQIDITEKPARHKDPLTYWNAKLVSDKLTDSIESVLDTLLGKPKAKTGQQVRYGSNKGSLFVTVSGDKCGWWKDFQTDEGGRSLLSLIQRETGFDFKRTLDHAASLVGLRESDMSEHITAPKINSNPDNAAEINFDAHQKQMIKVARSIAANSIAANGTLAETYLRSRGVTAEIPKTIYFNPSVYVKKYNDVFPAMVVKLFDEKGKVQSVHMTLLDEKTAGKANVEDAKLKFGPAPKSIDISLNQSAKTAEPSLIAEGIETALSLQSALPYCDVKAALDKSGFKRINPESLSQNIVLCLDNDLKNWREDKIITQALSRLSDAGKTVWVAMPQSISNQKTDFNDVLKTFGMVDIVNTVNRAEKFQPRSVNGVLHTKLADEVDIISHNNLSKTDVNSSLTIEVIDRISKQINMDSYDNSGIQKVVSNLDSVIKSTDLKHSVQERTTKVDTKILSKNPIEYEPEL